MRTFAFLTAVFFAFAIVLARVTGVTAETVWELMVGWLPFLARSASRVTLNPSGILTIAVCAGLLLVGGHRFAVWLSSAWGSRSTPETASGSADGIQRTVGRWPLRRTALLLAIFVLMFVAGISFIGLVHQTAWLASSPEPLSNYRLKLWGGSGFHRYNLRFIGLGVHCWADAYSQVPRNGEWPEREEGAHSWQTRILPFVSTDTRDIDFKADWNDPKNAPAFRRFVPHYLNPDFGELREASGFAVSHYAGNVRLFEQSERDVTILKNRADRLILLGEVARDFMAWGDPANLRDPALGINGSGTGFGNADDSGATFLMADGSTRFMATNIDRDVLAGLATPERWE